MIQQTSLKFYVDEESDHRCIYRRKTESNKWLSYEKTKYNVAKTSSRYARLSRYIQNRSSYFYQIKKTNKFIIWKIRNFASFRQLIKTYPDIGMKRIFVQDFCMKLMKKTVTVREYSIEDRFSHEIKRSRKRTIYILVFYSLFIRPP
jgi:hypothetical protein